jgi:ribosomal protein S18 acetylase RimI-like enzyme
MLADLATITSRPAEPGDAQLLRELFVQARPDFAMLPPDLRESILDLQVRAQRAHYAEVFPDASDDVLVADGVAVGRLILRRDGDDVRIIDVAVLASHRGQGIGTSVLRQVLADADRDGLAVSLSVWSANTDARRLYERLGFVVVEDSDGYLEMQRTEAAEGD